MSLILAQDKQEEHSKLLLRLSNLLTNMPESVYRELTYGLFEESETEDVVKNLAERVSDIVTLIEKVGGACSIMVTVPPSPDPRDYNFVYEINKSVGNHVEVASMIFARIREQKHLYDLLKIMFADKTLNS